MVFIDNKDSVIAMSHIFLSLIHRENKSTIKLKN